MVAGLGNIWGATAVSVTLMVMILGARGFRRDFTVGGLLAVLAGIIAVFPSVWLEALIAYPYPQDLLHAPVLVRFIQAFVLSALVEEFFKFAFFWVLFRRSLLFQARSNGVLLGVLLGVGFGGAESLNRALAGAPALAPESALPVWLVPYILHLVAGATMGFFFYRAYQEVLPSSETRNLLGALALPFFLHGMYNFVASSPGESAWVWASLLVLAGAFGLMMVLGEAKANPSPEESEGKKEVLESENPVSAIADLAVSPQVKAALVQELLARNGITGYSIVSLLRASNGILTVKSICLKDFQVCTIKLFSPVVVDPAGVSRFRHLFERLKENPPANILNYREFYEFARFLVVIRDYGFATLSEYVSALLTREERVDLALQILGGIKELWQRGLYHGRLTPQNLMFRQGRLVLADLGQALMTRDEERHRAFLAESSAGEEMWSFARDYRAARALLSWLAGDETILPVDADLREESGPTMEEPVERAEIALERYQVQSRSLARLLAERARRSFRQQGPGYTDIGIIALLRSHSLVPNPELKNLLEQASEAALADAREALLDRVPERALQSLSRYMELRPDASEVAGAELENFTTALLKKGDYYLLRKGKPSLALRFYRAASALNPGAVEPRGRMAMVDKVPLLPASAIYQFILLSALVIVVTLVVAQRVALRRPEITMSRANAEGWRTTASLGFQPLFQPAWEISFREPLSPYVFEDENRLVVFGEKTAKILSRENGNFIGELVLSDEYGGTAQVTAQPLLCDDNLLVPVRQERGTEVRYALRIFGRESAPAGVGMPVSGMIFGIGCWKQKAFVISSREVLRVDLRERKPDWKWSPDIGAITADGAVLGNLLLIPVGVGGAETAPPPVPEETQKSEPETPSAEGGESGTRGSEGGATPPEAPSVPAEPRNPQRPPDTPVNPSTLFRGLAAAARRPAGPSDESAEDEFKPYIVALSVHSGDAVFKMETEIQADFGLVLSGDLLIVAARDVIASYDLRRRKLRWSNGEILMKGSPVAAEGSLLIPGEQRAMILDLKTGAQRYETEVIYPVAECLYAHPYFVVPSARPHPLFPSARVHSLTVIPAKDADEEAYIDLMESGEESTIKAVAVTPDHLLVIHKRSGGDTFKVYKMSPGGGLSPAR